MLNLLRLPLLLAPLASLALTHASWAAPLPPGATGVVPTTVGSTSLQDVSRTVFDHEVGPIDALAALRLFDELAPPSGETAREYQLQFSLFNLDTSTDDIREVRLQGFADATNVEVAYLTVTTGTEVAGVSRSADGDVVTLNFEATGGNQEVPPDGFARVLILRFDDATNPISTPRLTELNGAAVPIFQIANQAPREADLDESSVRASHFISPPIFGTRTFERFAPSAPVDVEVVRWRGTYFHQTNPAANPPPPNTSTWFIEFWQGPFLSSSTPLSSQAIPDVEVSRTFLGQFDLGFDTLDVYDFEAVLDVPQPLALDEYYWIAITSRAGPTLQPIFLWMEGNAGAGDRLDTQQNFATGQFFTSTGDRALELTLLPEPGVGTTLLAGSALVAALARRRRAA